MKNKFLVGCLLVLGFVAAKPEVSWGYAPELTKAMDLTYNAQFPEAEAVLNSYISANPQDPMGYLVRGNMLDWKQLVLKLRGNLNQQSLAEYEQANKLAFLMWDKDQGNVDKMITLGNSYMFLSKKWLDLGKSARAGLILKKSQRHMEEAARKEPDRFDAYMANGIFNFYAANMPAGLAIIAKIMGISGDAKVGLELVTKSATNPNIFQNHALFVLSYMYGQSKKNYAMAVLYLNQLSAKFPNNPHFIYQKGEFAYAAKEYEKARQHFGEFNSFCQTHTCAQPFLFLMNYGIVSSYMQEGRVLEAAPYIEAAEKLNEHHYADRDSYMYLYKGQLLKAQGKKSEAKVYLQKVIDMPNGKAEAKSKAEQELGSI